MCKSGELHLGIKKRDYEKANWVMNSKGKEGSSLLQFQFGLTLYLLQMTFMKQRKK